ncbi:MAG: site-specific DNA-methyltransferase, partial [Magnetovibrio sp.]|nr:site-specific DNA-methyltransferase [Magnetovibrio sp.]
YPRLYLARTLLKDDGVIFISIDDNEAAHLRELCDLVFGGENFVANIMWQKRTSPDGRLNLGPAHDHIFMYAKNIEAAKETFNKLPLSDDRRADYRNQDNDPNGPWASADITGQTGHATTSQFYEITTPSGKTYSPPEGRCWALAERTFKGLVDDGKIWFGNNGDSRPRLKNYLSESTGVNAWTWWPNTEVGHNQEGTKEVKELLGAGDIFDNPKPTRLLKRILHIATQEDDLILDFFSGSGPTAHAVMALNAEDGGNRRFIAVQLPEPCEEKSEAFKAGYATIADIGKERMRRAGAKIKAEGEGELDLGGGKDVDVGFKVFKLDRSTILPRNVTVDDADDEGEFLDQHALHFVGQARECDVLYELLLKSGFPLETPIDVVTMAGKEVYSIEDGALLICLEKEITTELIDTMAASDPLEVICLDEGFQNNDQLKTNTVQAFKCRARSKETQIVFKTV